MKIVYIKFEDLGLLSKLIVKVSQTIEGKDWFHTVQIEGLTASELWSAWGKDNDSEILQKILEKKK